MSITDLGRLQEILQLNSMQYEWLNESKIVVSPFGDFLVVASSSAAVFYVKKYTSGSPEFQLCRIHRPTSHECGSISAVYYLPVRMEKIGRSFDMWHCVVIGYSSGLVEFVTESGQILASKQMHDKPVLKFRANSSGQTSAPVTSCLIHKLNELLVVYENLLVSISGSVLLSTLVKNRKELSTVNAVLGDASPGGGSLGRLQCKKWIIKDQIMTDVASVSTPSFPLFDQLSLISMDRSLSSEDHMKSIGSLVKYITVGQSTFIQTNTSHRFGPQKVHEIAGNVVSTVKTRLFQVATGFIWGSSPGGGNDEEPVVPDVEQKMEVLHAFKDKSKSAIGIEASPDGRYLAIMDNHHRIMIQDNTIGSVIHILKGYHHAQMGWISTSWDGRKETPDRLPNAEQEFSVLLVLYLPRRGILEIWSPEQMSRIVEFPVGKVGRLISSADAVLDASTRSIPSVRIFETAFLSPSGVIRKIYVPIHSLTSRSTCHDRTLHKQLKNILQQETAMEDRVTKLTEIILASKDPDGKIRMLLDIFHTDQLSSADCRLILAAVSNQLSECSIATRHCALLTRALDLYDFLTSNGDSSVGQIDWSDDEKSAMKIVLENLDGVTSSLPIEFTVAEFSSCFLLRRLGEKGSDISVGADISFVALCLGDAKLAVRPSLIKLVHLVGRKCRQDFEAAKAAVATAQIEGALLENFLMAFINDSAKDLSDAGPELQVLVYRLIFELNPGDVGAPSLVHRGRKLLLHSPMTSSTFLVMLAWRRFLHQYQFLNYSTEWDPVLQQFLSYLELRDARHRLLDVNDHSDEVLPTAESAAVHRYDDVFMAGNGRIAEIVADWLVRANVTVADDSSKDDDSAASPMTLFLTKVRQHFPLSGRLSIISGHMAWQHFQAWSKNHSDLRHLEVALEFLRQVKSLSTRQRLTVLAWSTFLSKSIRDAINLTENRCVSRCERELGMPEEILPHFLQLSTKIVRILLQEEEIQTNDENSNNDVDDFIVEPYDGLTSASPGCDHLMERVAKLSFPDSDVVSIQYQFIFVASVLWAFNLDDLKPLSMFNSQEANIFFQNASSLSLSSAFRLFAGEHGRSVRNARRNFLEAASDAAVGCIHHTTYGNEGLDFGLFHDWSNNLNLLAKMWRIVDKLRESQIVALYRRGFDGLGEEMFNSLDEDERKLTGVKLLRLCLLRLASFLNFDDEKERRVSAINPALMNKLSTLRGDEANLVGVVEVPLKATSDLLVVITNLDIDEASVQLAYECLVILQMFRKG